MICRGSGPLITGGMAAISVVTFGAPGTTNGAARLESAESEVAMGWMQYACRQAAALMSLGRDEPLSAWQGIRLALHLKVCGDCRQVQAQLAQIDRMQSALWDDAAGEAGEAAEPGAALQR